MPHHCHRSFNILVYARVNRISIGIRTCPPNLEKSCSSKCIGKHGETFVFSHRYRNLTQVSMKSSEPYHWYDLTTVHLPVIRQGYKWIHFREVAKQMWALVWQIWNSFKLKIPKRTLRNTDSKTQKQINLVGQSRSFGKRILSPGMGTKSAWALVSQVSEKHAVTLEMHLLSWIPWVYWIECLLMQIAHKVHGCSRPRPQVIQREACQRAISFNVAGWVQSNATSLSWDHQKRPLISLVFVFFITWVGNLRRQALSDIEYISSHHKKSRLFKTQTWRQPFDSREVSKRFPSM